MSGITIIDVKVVGMCSKHRTNDDEIVRNKKGEIIPDEQLCCLGCMLKW